MNSAAVAGNLTAHEEREMRNIAILVIYGVVLCMLVLLICFCIRLHGKRSKRELSLDDSSSPFLRDDYAPPPEYEPLPPAYDHIPSAPPLDV